ncbi:MAG: tetratricopeptide repeat protein [Nostoc sp. DedQUE08]|uniref:tetratricopeptide repeat protein n=1 Tax=Nostoc sp. DedQUE08 TaxID=3075393 RepID=UPI002AD35975|nr:tetratricopeptide repeat protein [Nostoc sp. DedQUE08]MDZ8066340.1 tetratricopeptide repeat protein [Nostoc sp. DedQUE08]
MVEEPSPSNSNNIEMNLTAYGDSKVTQVGQINAVEVKIIVDRIEPVLEQLQQISPPESPGVLKAGNPGKSLAYWQGRTAEIAQIQQWLIDKNTFLIGIEGIGGTGKSMLATKIYDEIVGFPKRFWADVSYGAGFSDLARQVLSEFGFPVPEQEAQLMQALIKCLQSGQYLLIIDNLESLLQPDRQWESQFYGDFFTAWVEYGGNSKVIVTTRERPELPKFTWLPLKGLQVAEGVALLTELGIRGDLGDFVELVDGHPLLLRLVADLLKEEYPQDADLRRLADLGLGNLRQLLTDPQVVGVHRLENVGMVLVLDASFERLSELQKTLLLNISVYRGAVESAAAVAMLPVSSAAEIERELRNLVKRSLLVEKLNGKRRFEFQPVVLEYVRYKTGNQTEAHQRAIDYYRSFAKQPPWTTKDDVKEYLEIFHHFYQLQDYNSAFDELWVCHNFLSLRGYYADQVELYRQLVSKWEEIGDRENWNYRASLTSLGNAYNRLGQYQRAIEFFQQSLEISKEISDRNGEGASLGNLGNAYNSLGQYQRAIEFYQQSLEISRETGNRNSEGASLCNLGNAYNSLGQYQRAIEFCQQSLKIFRDISDCNSEGASLMSLGNAYNSLGQYQRAIEFYQHSLEISREIGDRNSEGNSLMGLGNAYNSLGQYQRAIEFYQHSLEISREIGDRNSEGNSLGNLGNAYNFLGQYQRAIEFCQHSLEISREIGNRNSEGNSLGDLGNAYNSLGQYQRAIEFHEQYLNIAREMGDRNSEGNSLMGLGNAYNSLGQHQRAIEFFQQSLKIKREIGNRNGEGNLLNNLGNAYNSLGQHQSAIEFCHQSLEISREICDRNSEGNSLICLGNAYNSLGQHQSAIEFCHQSLEISREICDRNGECVSLGNLGNGYNSLGQHQSAIEFCQQSLEISREIGDRNSQGKTLNNLGNAYLCLGEYQRAIDFCQQSLDIFSQIGDRNGEAIAWFNLGEALENLNRESDALGAYRNARELCQAMGLDANLQDCNNAIERLSQPQTPVVFRRDLWRWLRRLWRWVRNWFRR